MKLGISRAMLFGLLCSAAASAAPAESCAGFSWNVSRERELFQQSAVARSAGSDSAAAPLLAPEQLYELQLLPLSGVVFVALPGRKPASMNDFGGLARLEISTPGIYDIAIDAPVWVDVVADGGTLNAHGFQGSKDCHAPHKIVEFAFPVARELLLQFSGADADSVRVTVTEAAR